MKLFDSPSKEKPRDRIWITRIKIAPETVKPPSNEAVGKAIIKLLKDNSKLGKDQIFISSLIPTEEAADIIIADATEENKRELELLWNLLDITWGPYHDYRRILEQKENGEDTDGTD